MKAVCIYILLGLNTAVFAQQYRVYGVVNDDKGKPLENVNVLLLKQKDSALVKGVVTTAQGKFELVQSFPGDYLLSFSKVGFQSVYSIQAIKDTAIAIDAGNILLRSDAKSLKEVTVTARKPFIEQKLDRMIVNIENSIISAGNNGLEVLEKLPGVSVEPNGAISLKGKGVQVHIDGRPTNMSADDLANFLRSLTASQIEKVEIISNPSSRYDAAGSGGIINIRMKKDLKIGFNGTATVGFNYGSYAKLNAGVNFNYRDRKKNFFGSYNTNDRKNLTNSTSDRKFGNSSGLYAQFIQSGKTVDHSVSHNVRGGADFFLSKKSTLGFIINVVNTRLRPQSDSKTLMQNGAGSIDSMLFTSSNNRSNWNIYTGNINFKQALDSSGKEIVMDLERSVYDRNNSQFFLNSPADALGNINRIPDTLTGISPTLLKITSIKADYLHPLKNNDKIEAGFKSSWVQNDNDLVFYNQSGNGTVLNTSLSNHFIYNEHINAVYLNYSREQKKWNYQLGLRGEQTITNGKQVTTGQELQRRNYFQLFPSAFVNFSPTDKHQLGFSYSRRIGRPSYAIVNPFKIFRDPYTYQEGNPFINPQLSNNFEINYIYNNIIIVGISYGNTYNSMTFVVRQDDVAKTTVETFDNLGKLQDGGITVSANLKIAKWWNSNNFFGMFYNHFRGVYGSQAVDNEGMIYNISINHSITLPKNYTIEMGGFYLSKQPQGILVIAPQGNLNVGVQKSFLQKRANIRLSVSDIFHTQQWKKITKFGNIDAVLKNNFDSRQIRLNLSWKFGKQTVPAEKKRKSSSEEEKNRIQLD